MERLPVSIRSATWPADGITACVLLRNYGAHLAAGQNAAAPICIANYDVELATLAEHWTEPSGVLLLAYVAGEPAGCVAIKVRPDRPGSCEMKRLWVEPHARGLGLGRSLAEAAVTWARSQGASALLLDTVPAAMPQAVALYLSFGFRVTERHNKNAVAGLQFMKLDLA